MIESLRTTQIAFFRFATPSGFLVGLRRGTKSIRAGGPYKGKSFKTICENVVSRYQTLVSSLPREAVFLHRQPKTEFITWPHRQPSNNIIITTRGYNRNYWEPERLVQQSVVWSSLYIKLDMKYKRTANEFAEESRIYKKTWSAKLKQSTEK